MKDDLEGALEALLRMRARVESSFAFTTSARLQSRREQMIEILDRVIAETKALAGRGHA